MKLWLRRVSSRFRFKMVAAALCSVVIVSLVGWIGLSYTNRVATVVTRTTDTTIPLLANAVSASNAMRTLTRAARDILSACDRADGSHHQWFEGTLTDEFAAIDALTTFLGQTARLDYEQKVHSAKEELQLTINNLASLCDTRESLQLGFEAQRQQTLATMTELDRLVNSMHWIEASVLPSINGGTPGPVEPTDADDGFMEPALHLAHISIHLAHLRGNLARAHSNQVLLGTSTQAENLDVLAALEDELEALRPDFDRLNQADTGQRTEALIARLSEVLAGPRGVHDIWRRVRLFDSGTAVQRLMVSRAEIALADVLRGLEDEARREYEQATIAIDAKILESRWVVGAVATTSSVVLLVVGLIIASRLTRPMENLTRHVEYLRKSDDLGQPTPLWLFARSDEIGALAQSFQQLILELANARYQLQEESRQQIRIQYDRLTAAIESIPQGLCLTDAEGRLLMINSRFLQLYDLTPPQVPYGMKLRDLLELCRKQGAKWMKRPEGDTELTLHETTLGPQMLDFRNERTIVVRIANTPEGGLVSVHEDITERRKQEEQITHLAHHDTLTGLVNRSLFREQLQGIQENLDGTHNVALLCLDLDDFKSVNDSLGHPIGDRLLIQVSERLRQCLSDSDQVARLGGDEFAVLMLEQSTPNQVNQLAKTLVERLGRPYRVDGYTVITGVSIGIAVAPRDGDDPDVLMKRADIALFQAKKDGRNTFRYFEPEMDAHIQTRRSLEMDLRKAIEQEALELHYQPQIGLRSQAVEGFEALLRWRHPERGYVSPEEFVAIAEEIGLIDRLGHWVLRRACEDALQWPQSVCIAVNLSPVQFRNDAFLDEVRDALATSGLNPERLELEITEGVLLEDTDRTLYLLETLRDIGVQIAMDDFGTGYSSLGYLRKFRFDKLKIDRSFVSGMTTSADSLAVVHAICGLCSSLGIETIAEGVESSRQARKLRQMGCRQGQGYHYSKAVPLAETLAFIKEGAFHEGKRNTSS